MAEITTGFLCDNCNTSSTFTTSSTPCENCKWITWGILGLLSSIISMTGMMGNSLVIYVMYKIRDTTPAGLLVRTLACSDLSYVTLRFIQSALPNLFWGNYSDDVYRNLNSLLDPLSRSAFCVTSCVTVLLAFHRYTAVSRVKVLSTESTLKRIRLQIVVSIVLSAALNLPRFGEYRYGRLDKEMKESMKNDCFHSPAFSELHSDYNYQLYFILVVYNTVFNKIPIILLPLFTAKLVLCLRRLHNRAITKLNMAQRTRTSMETRITILCITISVIFVLCNIPGIVYRHLWLFMFWPQGGKACSAVSILSMVASVLYQLNSSGIFFIYMKLSVKFRNVIFNLFRCGRETSAPGVDVGRDSQSGGRKMALCPRDDKNKLIADISWTVLTQDGDSLSNIHEATRNIRNDSQTGVSEASSGDDGAASNSRPSHRSPSNASVEMSKALRVLGVSAQV